MAVVQFPDPRNSTPEGIVAFGGDLEPETLLLAYRQGIFPWPISGLKLPWFCPPERAILEWDHLHISRSLARVLKKAPFRITLDQSFERVMTECARVPRPDQPGTWISSKMIRAYSKLHQLGHAHSVEVWDEDRLVGGLYGVDPGGAFGGESMFHHASHASKLALLFLMDHLRERGLNWMDIQVMTPHMEALGARLISRDQFLGRLQSSIHQGFKLF